ncbi:MAG: TonB family protein [Bacteroidaceae bacterium]|nr:TonB family protein [Bacteroidaceae bacterium]
MEDHQMTEQEFAQLVERLRPRLMQMGREFFGSDTEADEVVQETCLRAWGVRDSSTLTDAYILRIARNVCVSLWRGQRLQMMATDAVADNLSADATTPQEELEERENSEWLQSRLQRLPKAEREVWQLFYDEGLTVEEIAKARGISVGTVRKTISNVRSTLRKDVRRHFFNLRHLLIFILIALATGIGVAAIISPRGQVRGVIQKVFRLPEDTTIYDNVEVMPTYHGDIEALYRHIAAEIHYPESAMADSVQGRVIVRFVVEKDGRLTNFEIKRTPDDRLSAEAIRVLQLTEPWISAKNKGQDVRCHFVMPIVFRLN